MKKIIYKEFGIRSEILEYTKIGPKLNGMREGKPFVHNDEIRINIEGELHKVTKIHFFDKDNKLIPRTDVCLDTEHRIAGIFVNLKKEILILKRIKDTTYYCFPGGHKRECETVNVCLKREMLEETGIDITNIDTELILKIHEDGFEPESFYLIDLKDTDIVYEDEDPLDLTSKLTVHKLEDILDCSNLYPIQVIRKLEERY